MTEEKFDTLISERLAYCRNLLAAKGGEYATDHDRLHNFRRAAAIQRITPERALIGMWSKHLVSILDMIDRMDEGDIPPETLVAEKFTDAINYLLLLEAMIEDRRHGG